MNTDITTEVTINLQMTPEEAAAIREGLRSTESSPATVSLARSLDKSDLLIIHSKAINRAVEALVRHGETLSHFLDYIGNRKNTMSEKGYNLLYALLTQLDASITAIDALDKLEDDDGI